ncbi:unnamed protein product [Didymodactylos carnosus]|uniref:C2H2-type domain-containing protein n=1 Tax=Didymodactylos carnosus TaxID=1234261 RepID=A0A813UPW5_9BILA|nr:unnamed protein product [Didymodactylos carnosus]CAF0896937.1 unnamed protein product [Didymodactylos carnosus]CAF3613196.1 unnamed protein product [Didymodactylos carnosus]CAF3678210.1 unnamed protein product [Didymodactylos carnosus]
MYPGYDVSSMAAPNRAIGFGFDNNYLYQPGPVANGPSGQRPYAFHKRNERIDWRRIAAFDVDRIAREMDFQALQENLEQITFCNIDAEVDTRAIDPNFVKLFKMAQLTIDYLLLCQEQISAQLSEFYLIKNKSAVEGEDARRQIEKLKTELNDVKKESRKRRKMLETQQNMLSAQNYNYHVCPVCSRAFLNAGFLQAHLERRHTGVDVKKREHDIDSEKELQQLKEQIRKKEEELMLLRLSKDEIQAAQKRLDELNEKYLTLRTSGQGSPRRRDAGVTELLKENKILRAENDSQKQTIQQSEANYRKREEKLIRKHQREIESYKKTIQDLNDTINMLKNSGSETSDLVDKLSKAEKHYREERLRRKELEDKLKEANDELAQLRNRPPVDHRKPIPPVAPRNPSPAPSPQLIIRPRPVDLYLPRYCGGLIKKLNENPTYLHKFQEEARNEFIEEIENQKYLGISQNDTRLNDLEYKKKMKLVLDTRATIHHDLSNFGRIREDISSLLDKYVHERMEMSRTGNSSIRSSGGKLVTFEDEKRPSRPHSYVPSITTTHFQQPGSKSSSGHHHPHRSTETATTVQPKTRHDYSKPSTQLPYSTISQIVPNSNRYNESPEEDVSLPSTSENSDEDTPPPTTPGIDIQPSPRKNIPTTSLPTITTLVTSSMKPSIARQPVHIPESNKWSEESESESPRPAGVADKTKIIEKKLIDSRSKAQKPSIGAIAVGFHPTRETLATHNDDDSDSSLTTIDQTDQNRVGGGHLPQISGRARDRQVITNNNYHSSADVSHNTYDDLYKSQSKPDKGVERRPPTADSAKTSNFDSDVDLEDY